MSGFLVTLHPTAKKAIRAEVKGRMKSLSLTYINEMSSAVTSKLIEHPTYSLSKALCIYLSMAGEIQTYDIVQHAFDSGKRVFIPKVTGKNSADMFMLEVHSYSQIESFPKSSWGIPEPPIELVKDSVDATTLGIIDTVIVPGVAFDNSCGRIGHGKGYYGTCILPVQWCFKHLKSIFVPTCTFNNMI